MKTLICSLFAACLLFGTSWANCGLPHNECFTDVHSSDDRLNLYPTNSLLDYPWLMGTSCSLRLGDPLSNNISLDTTCPEDGVYTNSFTITKNGSEVTKEFVSVVENGIATKTFRVIVNGQVVKERILTN